MKPPKPSQSTQVAISDIRGIRPRATMRISSISELAPLLEELAKMTNGRFSISSRETDVFSTRDYSAGVRSAGSNKAVKLKFQDKTSYLRFSQSHRQTFRSDGQAVKMERLCAGMAHDINNLLNVTNFEVDSIEQRLADADQSAQISDISNNMLSLRDCLKMMQDICKRIYRLNEKTMGMQTINVATLVDDARRLSRQFFSDALSRGKRLTLAADLEPDLTCSGIYSETLMCLINLLYNSIKHGYEPGTQGTITIRAFREAPGRIIIRVSNDGKPIPEDLRPLLFEKPLDSADGHGRGLYTCAESLRAFGASISFVSVSGETSFVISLLEYHKCQAMSTTTETLTGLASSQGRAPARICRPKIHGAHKDPQPGSAA